jgi:allantoate deiminase
MTRAEKVIGRCRELARISDVPGETTRLFLSPATRRAHDLLLGWMGAAGLETRVDDAGSLRGVLRSHIAEASTLLLFSHIDTVPNAGAFDGPLGVLVGLAAMEQLRARGAALPFHIELIAFSEEEGVRFGFPFLSSLAATGQLTAEHLGRTDDDGTTVADAIRAFGLDPARIASSCALAQQSFAAIEVHIEQGPVLDAAGEALAVVQGVIGQSRLRFTFEGRANHAGTTPMSLRQDALTAAAAWTVAVERYAAERDPLVATVGRIEVSPGAMNVVPGRAEATLDVRHPEDAARHKAVADLETAAQACAEARGVQVRSARLSEQAAMPTDAALTAQLAQAAARAGFTARPMFSGAGHDAMILAPHVPTTMLFVRSPGGLSHHPDETVREDDVEAALATVLEFIRELRP